MKTVNLHAAKTHLSRLVDEAVNGEDIVIAKAGRPLVRLVALDAERRSRSFGSYKDKIWMSEDFNELGDDLAIAFGIDPEEERKKRKAMEKRALARRKLQTKKR
jgi:prevent-host-death family protein